MKITLFVCLSMVFLSCERTPLVFQDSYQFHENGWTKDEVVQFQTDFKDPDSEYRIKITLCHDKTYMYSNLLFSLLIETPDGAERNTDFEIDLKDDNRNFTGTPSGDKIVFEFDGLKRTSFSKSGNYIFRFSHYMPFEYVGGIEELKMEIYKIQE